MHCNALQHTATHCNTLQHTATRRQERAPTAAYRCNALQHNATHCNTLQHTATHCNTLQHTATHCNTQAGVCTNCCLLLNKSDLTKASKDLSECMAPLDGKKLKFTKKSLRARGKGGGGNTQTRRHRDEEGPRAHSVMGITNERDNHSHTQTHTHAAARASSPVLLPTLLAASSPAAPTNLVTRYPKKKISREFPDLGATKLLIGVQPSGTRVADCRESDSPFLSSGASQISGGEFKPRYLFEECELSAVVEDGGRGEGGLGEKGDLMLGGSARSVFVERQERFKIDSYKLSVGLFFY